MKKLFDFYSENGLYDEDIHKIICHMKEQTKNIVYSKTTVYSPLQTLDMKYNPKRIFLVLQRHEEHLLLYQVYNFHVVIYDSGRPVKALPGGRY